MKKRMFSASLAIVLLFSLLSPEVFAYDPEEAPYTTWKNAAVVTPETPVSFVLDRYNNNFTDEQVWLAVTAEADDQAIELAFSGVEKTANAYIYSAAALDSAGPTSQNMLFTCGNISGNTVVRRKVSYAGVYYILLRPNGSGYLSAKPGSLTVRLLDGDTNENNDTRESAAALTVNVDTIFNLNGSNDVDWFAVDTLRPGQAIKVVLSNFNYEVNPVDAYLYSEAGASYLVKRESVRTDTEFYWKATEPARYYLRLSPSNYDQPVPQDLKVRYELVDGDANENNDVWTDATALIEGQDAYYTLTGGKDYDWFQITTAVPGEAIKVILGGFDYTSRSVDAVLYSREALEKGSSNPDALYSVSGNQAAFFRWKANEPGDYYLRLSMSNDYSVNLKEMTVRFELVPPDAYELNDTCQTATPIPQDGYEMEFTLNGGNDADWFCFETELENDVVTISFRGFETDYSNRISYYIYDFDASSGTQTRLEYANSVTITHERTFICPTPGKHYIEIRPYNREDSFENLLRMKIEHRSVSIDEGEPNDTWQTATALSPDVAAVFNLPNISDDDWFKLTVTEPQQTLDLRMTVPAGSGGDVYATVYSGEALELYGFERADAIRTTIRGASSGTYTGRCRLSAPGEYYVLVRGRGKGFEEDATLTCSLIAPDEWEGEENNNVWKRAAELSEGAENFFTLPAENDTDWFRFTAPEPNQTIEITLDIPAGGGIMAYLYSGDDLWTLGDNTGSLTAARYANLYAGVRTIRYMLSDAGEYYLKIYPAGSDDQCLIDADATLTYRFIEPDRNEGNNTWQTATAINEGVATIFTLPAYNDADWYKFTATEDNMTVEATVTVPDGGVISWSSPVYSGTDLAAYGVDNSASVGGIDWISGTGCRVNRCMLGEAGEYYLCVRPDGSDLTVFDRDATLTFRLLGSDSHERNNTWQTAAPVTPQSNVPFTLPAYNDEDWFSLGKIDAGDKFSLTFHGLPLVRTGTNGWFYGDVRYRLYLKGEYDANISSFSAGQSVSSNSNGKAITFTASTTGDYYLKVYYGNSSGFDATLWPDPVMSFRYAVIRDATPVKALAVSSIGNAPTTIYQGKTLGLYPVFTPANASDQRVTWSSGNTAVATVDENGIVTAVAPGTARITCTAVSDTSVHASSTITVAEPVPVKGVTVTTNEIHREGESNTNPKLLSLGTAIQLRYSTVPEGATEQEVTWSVSDDSVLSITNYGKVAAIGSGTAFATVTTLDGGYTANYYVYVPDQTYAVSRVTLNTSAETLYMGESGIQLIATIHPSYATNQHVTWTSSNSSVAAVDQSGNVSPVSTGYATITVSAQENPSLKAVCSVSVQPARTRVTGIRFAGASLELGLYGVTTLVPVIAPANATDQTVSWTSSNKNIVSVSRSGVVTGLNVGTATVTATTTDGSFAASVTVRVSSSAPLGDVNNDGEADAADALLILRSSVRLIALTEAQKSVADVNGDGSIDAGDAVLILRYDAGLIHQFPRKD